MSDFEKFIGAFKSLTPANQKVIACLVFELAKKDNELSEMAKKIMELLDK